MEKIFKISGRKRIRDRGIFWEEKYGEKSGPLKKRFEKQIGHNSYLRWEGHDVSTNSDYFVVVGPSLDRYGNKMFFSGIKKLPIEEKRKKIYAPSGKYFPNMAAALIHANQMWGVIMPEDQPSYDQDSLSGIDIPRKIKG